MGGAEEMATDLQPCVSSPKLPSPAGEAGRGLRSASPAPCGRLSSAVPRKVGPDNRPAPRALCALQEAVSQMEASGTQPPHRQGWGDLRPPSLGRALAGGGRLCGHLRVLQGWVVGSGIKGVCGEGGLVHFRGQKQSGRLNSTLQRARGDQTPSEHQHSPL